MPTIQVKYKGDLRTAALHLKSSSEIITDAPTDNYGKGETFSPTDLVAASLASCMLTVMGIKANNAGFQFKGAETEVAKKMASNPRRISMIEIKMKISPADYNDEQKKILKNAAIQCPVAKSLNEDIEQVVDFEWL